MDRRVIRIVQVVAIGALVVLVAFGELVAPPTVAEWRAALFFTAFGVLAAALSYQTSQATHGTIGFLPFLSVAIVSPNIAALLAVLTSSVLAELFLRRAALKLVFNASQQTFSVAAGIAVFLATGGRSVIGGNPEFVPFVLLVGTYFVVNKLAVSTVVAASNRGSTLTHWVKSMRGSALYDALSIPLIVFFAIAYARLGAGWTAILALPMLGVRQLYRTVYALEKVNEELLQLMVASIEARDPYTSGHSQRVALYAREIARLVGLPARQIERVEIAALLHDVGKIHERFAHILRKPGRLTDAEFAQMKLHPIMSAELVGKVSHFSDLVPAVRAHHETWDGRGYPDQLSGDNIPLAARVIAVADTIDAMTTSRPYRAGMTMSEVRDEIIRERSRQFDPRLADVITMQHAWAELSAVVARAQLEHPANEQGEIGSQVLVGNTGEFVLLSSR